VSNDYGENSPKGGLHRPFELVDWGKLRMDSPSAIATRFRAVQTGVLSNSSIEGLAADETMARLLTRDWLPRPEATIGISKRRATTGSALSVTGTRNALATLTTTVVITDPTPSNWGSAVALSPGVITPDFQPRRLDFGELKVQEERTARVTLICPNDTTLGVAWADQSKAEGELTPRFTVVGITTYSSGWKSLGKVLGHVREVDQTTAADHIDVREGQEVSIDVRFASGSDETGRFSNTLQIGGGPWQVAVPAQVNVTLLGDAGTVLVDVHGSLQALKGHGASLDLTLTRIGQPTDVLISADYLPQGVAMNDVSLQISPDEQRNVTLHFDVAQNAPTIRDFQASLGIASQAVLRELGIGISIYNPILISTVNVKAGSMTGSMEVTLTSDGAWTWHAELEEHGAFVGEAYTVDFGLIVPGDAGNLGLYRIDQHNLAAKALPGESQKTIDQSGVHPDIRDHFFELVDAGVYFEADVADNAFPILVALDSLFISAPAAVVTFKDLFAAPAAAAA
jgi:hypothetical protein